MSPADQGRFRVGVLASGTGTNLQALLDSVHGRDGIEIVGVGSDSPDAVALSRADAAGIATRIFPRDDYAEREVRDLAIADWLVGLEVDLVVLAGYMQLLSPAFIRRFANRVINVHPALLPSFPGLDAVGQALAHGVRLTGVTVHFVDEDVDTGPILLQRAIELTYTRPVAELMAQIHDVEHELLPLAVRLIAAGAVSIDERNPRLVRIDADGV